MQKAKSRKTKAESFLFESKQFGYNEQMYIEIER